MYIHIYVCAQRDKEYVHIYTNLKTLYKWEVKKGNNNKVHLLNHQKSSLQREIQKHKLGFKQTQKNYQNYLYYKRT